MLELSAVTISLDGKTLLRPFSLQVAPQEVVTIMGGSGSGKSSLLSYIGGTLAEAFKATGEIMLNSLPLHHLPPEKRKVGRLFQDDLLFPHMTVSENLLFATPAAPRTERLNAVQRALEDVGLAGYADRAPHTLSGGQRQRVALMRALLAEPHAILFDEPFSKLDAELRADMRSLVFSHITSRNIPALLVTHDKSDAPQGGRVFAIVDSEVKHV
jgi:putative thiamine transport system ATP-binding protein